MGMDFCRAFKGFSSNWQLGVYRSWVFVNTAEKDSVNTSGKM
jgi:hypothetical protein